MPTGHRRKLTDPVRFRIVETEKGLFEIYRLRVRLNKRLLPIKKAALVVYLLCNDNDAVTIDAFGKSKVWVTGLEFRTQEQENMKFVAQDRGMRQGDFYELLEELGIIG